LKKNKKHSKNNIKQRRKQEENKKKNKLLNIRKEWLREELDLNINSNMFGMLGQVESLTLQSMLVTNGELKSSQLHFLIELLLRILNK